MFHSGVFVLEAFDEFANSISMAELEAVRTLHRCSVRLSDPSVWSDEGVATDYRKPLNRMYAEVMGDLTESDWDAFRRTWASREYQLGHAAHICWKRRLIEVNELLKKTLDAYEACRLLKPFEGSRDICETKEAIMKCLPMFGDDWTSLQDHKPDLEVLRQWADALGALLPLIESNLRHDARLELRAKSFTLEKNGSGMMSIDQAAELGKCSTDSIIRWLRAIQLNPSPIPGKRNGASQALVHDIVRACLGANTTKSRAAANSIQEWWIKN